MKINTFSLVSVLLVKVLRKNKLDMFFKGPTAFSSKEKAGKKKVTSAPAAVFQVPFQPKKQTWFFFLERFWAKKKNQKRNPFRERITEEDTLVTQFLCEDIDRHGGNVKGLWLLPNCKILVQHPSSLRVRSLSAQIN